MLFLCTKGTVRGAALFLISSLFLTACGRQEEAFGAPAVTTVSAAPSNKDMAEIGKLAFFDPSLSASGKQSCASCHSPSNAYGPPNGLAVQLGGIDMTHAGTRATPSLRYLRRVPIWTHTYASSFKERLEDGDNMPSGGYTWDGRFDSPAAQAAFPLLNPNEMANTDAADVTAKLSRSAYAARFSAVFGRDIFSRPADALAALGKALERFQFDDPSFQPFDSKFDKVLDGKAQFSTQEARGFALFNDPDRGNCASCHLVEKGAAGAHPTFTDYNFQTLGVPRNPEIPANSDPKYYDMGLCGPIRTDKTDTDWYCGMFRTPTLRNVATRRAFFHNGRFHTLEDSLRFYVQRDTNPQKWYPHAGGKQQFDDLPVKYQRNVDHLNAPMTNHKGGKPVWSEGDIRDVIAFLKTLNDSDAQMVRSTATH
ncbi:Methylamine utilization protein MauG [Paraburkholderia fynbosensis]|uniref:Methylamine utilization protein MauG n=2 Tax=Paraburkholderia fynbosensis TaxID=1200993 RepID=A0A6J5GF99_9BURK|nr:cytochrome c peroxidase [Paraburkholderia fynbosensis]CAB3798140.1 Methylamine utilization protein MauG [Paraburkholderia fynbosensis]